MHRRFLFTRELSPQLTRPNSKRWPFSLSNRAERCVRNLVRYCCFVGLVLVALSAAGAKANSAKSDAAPEGADYSCGVPPGTSIFHRDAPPPQFQKLSARPVDFGNGSTLRTNVVVEIEIVRGTHPDSKVGRIIRPISDGLPKSLIGKLAVLDTGGCSALPEIGARGIVWGTIHAESSDRPSISLY